MLILLTANVPKSQIVVNETTAPRISQNARLCTKAIRVLCCKAKTVQYSNYGTLGNPNTQTTWLSLANCPVCYNQIFQGKHVKAIYNGTLIRKYVSCKVSGPLYYTLIVNIQSGVCSQV